MPRPGPFGEYSHLISSQGSAAFQASSTNLPNWALSVSLSSVPLTLHSVLPVHSDPGLLSQVSGSLGIGAGSRGWEVLGVVGCLPAHTRQDPNQRQAGRVWLGWVAWGRGVAPQCPPTSEAPTVLSFQQLFWVEQR